MMKKILVLLCGLLIYVHYAYADAQLGRGELLFKQCAGCHGANGKNKAFGKSGILAGQTASELKESLLFYKDSNFQKHGTNAVMAKQVKSLNDQDIAALADYISQLSK